MTPQGMAEKIVAELTALGCQAQFGSGLRALGKSAYAGLEALAPERSGAFYDFAFGGPS